MKPSITLNFDTISEMNIFMAMLEGVTPNAPAASPVPAGHPAPPPIAPQGAPQPVPAPTQAPPPPPQQAAPPPPAGNGADAGASMAEVMKAMADYAKTHKAAGVRNVLSHVQLGKVTEANPAQLVWLLAAFNSNQPYALAT